MPSTRGPGCTHPGPLASDPALAPEDAVERDGHAGDDGRAEEDAPGPTEPGVGHVLAEPPRHGGRDGDDRGPAGELLHHRVEPGVLQRQVGLEDRRHHVAQRLGPLGSPEDVVVEVVVEAVELGVPLVELAPVTEHRVDDVAHRQHDTSQLDELLAQPVGAHLDGVRAAALGQEHREDLLSDESGRTPAVQVRTYRLRKELVELRRVVLPMRDVVNAVLRHRGELDQRHTELDGFYDDLYDHVLRAAEWTESLRDMVTTIFETNLSLQDARLNTVMKKLTGWAAIIAVPTAVTGWFGQNVPYPGFGRPWGVLFSAAVIAGVAVTLYGVFRRKGWI